MESLINTGRLVQKFLPKQADINIIINVIQRKVLKGTHLPATKKEIKTGYLLSSYFKYINLYLPQNGLPSTKTANQKVETLTERYILLDSLLFRLVTMAEKEMPLLPIPEVCADKIITLYYSNLFAGHQGVIKHILQSAINFIPNLIHHLYSYIKDCHICQLAHSDKPPTRQLQTGLNLSYRPLSRLSMDLKVIQRQYKEGR